MTLISCFLISSTFWFKYFFRTRLAPSLSVSLTAGGVPFWHPTSFSKATLAGRHLATVPNYIDQSECPPGHWCSLGIRHPCPQGTYGRSKGLSSARCDGPCYAGYFCPQGSTEPTPCPAGQWCDGNTTVCFFSFVIVFVCSFCIGSVFSMSCGCTDRSTDKSSMIFFFFFFVKVSCPVGRYGAPGELLGSAECSGPCSIGHWCPSGSTSSTEKKCPGGTFGAVEGKRERRHRFAPFCFVLLHFFHHCFPLLFFFPPLFFPSSFPPPPFLPSSIFSPSRSWQSLVLWTMCTWLLLSI